MRVSRTQWAVGHGFFHSGTITAEGKPVTYVYDCGATTKNQRNLKREIDEFVSRLYVGPKYQRYLYSRSRNVDIMYISHFDYDHISGIPYLAKQTSVSRFVIPMTPVSSRIFCLAGSLFPSVYYSSSNNSSTYDANVGDFDEWYWDFIANPVTALREITGPDVEIQQMTPLDEEEIRVDETVSEDYILTNSEIRNSAIRSYSDLNISQPQNRLNLWNITNLSGAPVWEFKTHVLWDAQNQAAVFVQKLKQLALINDEKDLEDVNIVRNLVLNHTSDLKKAFKDAVAMIGSSFTLNITSLMLYSGTVLGQKLRTFRSKAAFYDRPEIGAWPTVPGWIGYGDASLGAKKRLHEAIDAFAEYRSRTYVIAPPHHGSPREWGSELLEGYGLHGNDAPTCVFGADGSYGHPAQRVLLDVNASGGTAIVVTSDCRSRWTDSLTVYVDA